MNRQTCFKKVELSQYTLCSNSGQVTLNFSIGGEEDEARAVDRTCFCDSVLGLDPRGYSQTLYTGRLRPVVQSLTYLQKSYPILRYPVNLLLTNGTPFINLHPFYRLL